MSARTEMLALRTRVGWLESSALRCLRITGSEAYEATDALLPIPLRLQDAELRQTLLLDEAGHPWADVTVGRDDEDYVLLIEGLAPEGVATRVRDLLPEGMDASLEDETETHSLVSIHGPWAWEMMAELLGPHVVGQTYLTLLHVARSRGGAECLSFRASKTGEYGYDVLVAKDERSAFEARLGEVGRAFDVDQVSQSALDVCALENGFFCIREPGSTELTPLELGLQWRVSRTKPSYVGREALLARLARPQRSRLTAVIAERQIAAGDAVTFAGQVIGRMLHAVRAPLADHFIGHALLDLPYAAAGVDVYVAQTPEGPAALRTVSPPLVDNLSLRVDPHRHSYPFGRRPA